MDTGKGGKSQRHDHSALELARSSWQCQVSKRMHCTRYYSGEDQKHINQTTHICAVGHPTRSKEARTSPQDSTDYGRWHSTQTACAEITTHWKEDHFLLHKQGPAGVKFRTNRVSPAYGQGFPSLKTVLTTFYSSRMDGDGGGQ